MADSKKPTTGTDPSLNAWQIAGIKEALASLDRGEGVRHEVVKAWAASLSAEDEIPPT